MRATLDFLLHDWLQAESLALRPRHAEHSRQTFDAVLDTCERIARERFAPFNRLVDTEEPRMATGPDGLPAVVLPQATHQAWRAYADSGMLAAGQDEADGGMALPYVVEAAANALFSRASVSISAALLTVANAKLLRAHGTPRQQQAFAAPQFAGRWAGTMCLSEPQAGSSLSDIATRAVPDGPGHEADPLGPRGISLFIVPKWLVDAEGRPTGQRNDVVLAGLNHKCGWRGTPNTLLNFGEGRVQPGGRPGAVGYLVGAPGAGLRCMFHMMNEARIGIGMAATALGIAGYEASLAYARERRQGRPATGAGKDAAAPPVAIIEHADVRRMLLAQRAFAEGALALQLYCARLVDEQHGGEPEAARQAGLLLELLTPVAKSWPSEWCLEANSLAIQVLGGYGYTRDFPVEQYWRDNRLNMIHEGTHGIQALDLLGRKVVMDGGAALALFADRVRATAGRAAADPALADDAAALQQALQALLQATRSAWDGARPEEALANATPYLQAFGHLAGGWMWLELALAAGAAAGLGEERRAGIRATARCYFAYELPRVAVWLAPVARREPVCRTMRPEWF